MRSLAAEPLTADAFAPFGDVIEASERAEVIPINYGWTTRFNALADVAVGEGHAILSIFRSKPLTPLVLKIFERHPLGSQAFVPMQGRPYLVAVAPPGEFDVAAVRVFRAGAGQGVNYAKGTWHHFLLALDAESDFLVVDREGPGENLDEIALAEADWIAVSA
ncbi:MAG: ureidoglycolate lyase [Alphaproteobacteria bacterium]|nr:ureidoglycolate lyase [Alphaproteobacteria bacterium]MBU1515253.1 ureidoglycolate lyase [Alphaproteobacteria bacterium]MBU2092383.1 ureidoglycolate lyase [Alphaproteobacteria bacterium]MBU2152977.1 ureidoglycolate lyase [Alphaproteobacteria bacterium]MBU2305808.1 ureidoglycolate lyase [Alphaproteobacteria bacterium]